MIFKYYPWLRAMSNGSGRAVKVKARSSTKSESPVMREHGQGFQKIIDPMTGQPIPNSPSINVMRGANGVGIVVLPPASFGGAPTPTPTPAPTKALDRPS